MAKIHKIEYKEKGFWIHYFNIELLSQYICETMESIGLNTFNQNLNGIYFSCDLNRTGENYGMVGIPLDRYITNTSDKATMINILNQTKTSILALGDELSIAMLTAFENNKTDDYNKDEWGWPVKTKSLTNLIDLIIMLLNEEELLHNGKDIVFVGWPSVEGNIVI